MLLALLEVGLLCRVLGCGLGLLLDLKVRDATSGSLSLDDVMWYIDRKQDTEAIGSDRK